MGDAAGVRRWCERLYMGGGEGGGVGFGRGGPARFASGVYRRERGKAQYMISAIRGGKKCRGMGLGGSH